MAGTLLFIGSTWPEVGSTAASERVVQLLHFFSEHGYAITFASVAQRNPKSLDLSQWNISQESIALNDPSFDAFLKELDPKLVVFDRFMTEEQFGWRVAEHAPQAVRILDTEDLHSLRDARETCYKNEIAFTPGFWLQQERTKRELASIYRCDISLVISQEEMELLKKQAQIPQTPLLYLPFLYDSISEKEQSSWPTFTTRKDFVFIGTGRHAPNVDAVQWLKQSLWPMLRKKLPEAQLHIYGSYLPQKLTQLHQPKEGFYVKGWTEDASQVLQEARMVLAPLRFGAGLKGKLVRAMQDGTPFVTTTVGIEGLGHPEAWENQLGANAADFVNKAVALYTNEHKWQQCQERGFRSFNALFDKREHGPRLLHLLNSLETNLMAHRNRNVVGSLLWQQGQQASKYMAKWIEAKNKVSAGNTN